MIELLNANRIESELTKANQRLFQLEILNSIDSTNRYLLNKQAAHHGMVVLAEEQTQGRGRLGRAWVSPFGSNLYLSLLWQFTGNIQELAGLSLALGIAIVNALETYGLKQIQLKWPNDILFKQQKLGGILIETKQAQQGLITAVIGIGINVHMPTDASQIINQPWIDIYSITGKQPNRNQLAGLILNELARVLVLFQSQGLNAFQDEWQRLDAFSQQAVSVNTQQGVIKGIAKGIDQYGNLLIETEGKLQTFNSAEISVRLQS